jgi:hypothetical protein
VPTHDPVLDRLVDHDDPAHLALLALRDRPVPTQCGRCHAERIGLITVAES